MEELYYQARLEAYKTALFMLYNEDEAEEIAQEVSLKLCRRKEMPDNAIAWCVKVAQNEVKALYRKKKNNPEFTTDAAQLEYFDAVNKASSEEMEPEFETIKPREAKKLLLPKEYEFYKLMIKYKLDINKISKHLGKNKQSIYHLSYRVKRNLVAAKLLKEGYRGTRKIVSYNFHQNLIQFINLLQKKMLNNDLNSLKQYFNNMDIDKIDKLDIHKMLDYDLKKNLDQSYRILLPYYDSKKNIKFCIATIDFDINNRIVIKKLITKPLNIMKTKHPEKIKKMVKPPRNGLLVETLQEMKEIFKKT